MGFKLGTRPAQERLPVVSGVRNCVGISPQSLRWLGEGPPSAGLRAFYQPLGFADRPLRVVYNGGQLRLCQHLARNPFVEQTVEPEELARSTMALVRIGDAHIDAGSGCTTWMAWARSEVSLTGSHPGPRTLRAGIRNSCSTGQAH